MKANTDKFRGTRNSDFNKGILGGHNSALTNARLDKTGGRGPFLYLSFHTHMLRVTAPSGHCSTHNPSSQASLEGKALLSNWACSWAPRGTREQAAHPAVCDKSDCSPTAEPFLCHKEMDEPLRLHTKKPKTIEFLSQKERRKKKKSSSEALAFYSPHLHVIVTAPY